MSEGLLKNLPGISREDVHTAAQQFLDLGIGFRDPFDDQPVPQISQELGQACQRDIVGNGQMVNQGQRQDHVRRPALEQRLPLPIVPADGWTGVRQVKDERQQVGQLFGFHLLIVLLDGGRIDIECQGEDPLRPLPAG